MGAKLYLRHRAVIAAVLVAGSALGIRHLAHADTGRRDSLIAEINSLLDEMASLLNRAAGDSDGSSISTSIDRSSTVSSRATELAREADDSTAQQISSRYPNYASSFASAARSLATLKQQHHVLDPLVSDCTYATRSLTDGMTKYVDQHDPDGIDAIPQLVQTYGTVGVRALEQCTKVETATYQAYRDTQSFSITEDRWSYVTSAKVATAEAINNYVTSKIKDIRSEGACGSLALLQRNPAVEKAMRALTEGKQGIQMLFTTLDEDARKLADELDRAGPDTSVSYLTTADGELTNISYHVDQLERVQGSDREAVRRVRAWRDLVRAARDELTALRTLKESEFRADAAPAKCGAAVASLEQLIRQYVDAHDPKGRAEIAARARDVGAPLKEALDKTDAQHSIMERALSDAQHFDVGEPSWRDVKDKASHSASVMFDDWKQKRAAAHAACDEIAKGEQSPLVVNALRELETSYRAGRSDLDVLVTKFNAFTAEASELRRWDDEDTETLRNLFCNAEESPGDDDAGAAYESESKAVADRLVSRVQSRWTQLNSEASDMTALATKLIAIKDEDAQTKASTIRANVGTTISGLRSLNDARVRGSNNPKIRAKIEYGKSQHASLQGSSSNCDVSEVSLPSGRRIDCVKVNSGTCWIYEIKPRNAGATSRARDQLAKYKSEVNGEFDDVRSSNGEARKNNFKGKMSLFLQCMTQDAISLNSDIIYYDYCPSSAEISDP